MKNCEKSFNVKKKDLTSVRILDPLQPKKESEDGCRTEKYSGKGSEWGGALFREGFELSWEGGGLEGNAPKRNTDLKTVINQRKKGIPKGNPL